MIRTYPSDLKTCKRCLAELPRASFYAHPRMADGLLSFCKPCVRERVTAHREKNIESIRERDRLRHKGKRPRKEPDRQKYVARMRASSAIARGELIRQPCEVCGEERTDAHHDDYSKPLDVRWLCRRHHRQHHARIELMEKENEF